MEINWTLIGYLIIGLFAIAGYLKGWWREAVTALFLGILVFLLKFPDAAQWVVGRINDLISIVWDIIPDPLINFFLPLGISAADTPQIDPGSGQGWLIILLLFIALSVLISRALLPNQLRNDPSYYIYPINLTGSVLGGLLGGLNGYVILNLIREYLSESKLPFGTEPTTEVAMSTAQAVDVVSAGANIRLADLPSFTVLDNFFGWFIIGFALLIALLAVRSGESPYGYTKRTFTGVNEK